MKHSKNSLKKYLFFFVLTIAICYGIGLSRGAYPNEWRYLFGQPSSSISLLTSNAKFIPLQILIAFEKTTGIRVEFNAIESYHLFQSEAQKNDLLLAPFSWVTENSGTLPDSDNLEALLDDDFRSLKLKPQIFLPLFWNVNAEQELKLWGFYTHKETEINPETAHLIRYLLEDPNRLSGWTLQVGSSSTIKTMNERNDLSIELKPLHLRSFQLSKLKMSTEK